MSAHDQAVKYSSFPSIERKALSHALFDYGKSAFQDPAIQEEYRQWQERKMSVQSGQTESAHQLRNEAFTVILSSHTNEIEVLQKLVNKKRAQVRGDRERSYASDKKPLAF